MPLGRAADAIGAGALDDPKISREHAVITAAGDTGAVANERVQRWSARQLRRPATPRMPNGLNGRRTSGEPMPCHHSARAATTAKSR